MSQRDLPEDRHYKPFQCTATGIGLAPLNTTPARLLVQWETQEPCTETRASLLPSPPPALTHNCCSQNLPSTLLPRLFLTSTCSLLPSRAPRGTTDSFYFYSYSLTQSWTEEKQQEPTCKAIQSPQGLKEDHPQLSSCTCSQQCLWGPFPSSCCSVVPQSGTRSWQKPNLHTQRGEDWPGIVSR